MQLGMIGLGRMGANMVRRLLRAGHQCVVFDRSAKAVQDLVEERAVGSDSGAGLAGVGEYPARERRAARHSSARTRRGEDRPRDGTPGR